MVGNATYTQHLTSRGVNELAHITMEALHMFLADFRAGGFDMKNDMQIDFT